MHVLIVEDDRPIAEDIQDFVKKILKKKLSSVHIETTLDNALAYLNEKTVDVLLLDLNLNAKDGFQILRQVVSKSFYTIVISANTNRAIEAYEYGVLDFIPKPHSIERLKVAFQRLESSHAMDGHAMKYLSIKKGFKIQVFPLDDVLYFKSADVYVELHMKNKRIEIYNKLLKQLIPLLPSNYCRIHKSYIVDTDTIKELQTLGGGHYRVLLKSGDYLPVSRQRIKTLKELLDI
jgi:two-component system response regulator LytT